jgi:hypothetical protein
MYIYIYKKLRKEKNKNEKRYQEYIGILPST